MKILHIGDIHLGSHLENFSRNEEIKKVFSFILDIVKKETIQAVLIAGDVFDNGHPSTESQNLYYNFLMDLRDAGCNQVIVIAGNHDNPNFLDAPKWLLERLDIHVVGNIDPDDLTKEIFPLGDRNSPEAIVCAVPYLEHKGISIPEHYQQTWKLADQQRQGRSIPIIGMGHLYATGSSFGTGKADNVVGKLEGIDLESFASSYNYMALGHIHAPQKVAGHDNWRYAGSILPMKIQEHNRVREIVILDTENISTPRTVEIPDSCVHPMKYISGDLEELRTQLKEVQTSATDTWIKIVYTGKAVDTTWSIQLRREFKNTHVQIVEEETRRPQGDTPSQDVAEELPSLASLTPEGLFQKYLNDPKNNFDKEQTKKLLELYRSAQAKVYSPQEQEEAIVATTAGVMKFKRLYIKNINSLYDENIIDFEDPAFNTGIFLIDGPTGAGKSSILDAICLALYGQTPRSGKISTEKNPVMSQGTNEMCAELTFSLGGDEYCASFSQRRTRKGSNKPFSPAKYHLTKNEKEQAKGSESFEDEITKLIGMNLGQFTQCVLLAQGGFDKFLKADGKDRAPLLTQITGTEIYNKIGSQINEEFSNIKHEKNNLEIQLRDFQCLPDTELDALKQQKAEIQKKLDDLNAKIQTCNTNEEILKNISDHQANVQKGENDLTKAQDAQAAFAPQQKELDEAQKAQPIQVEYRVRCDAVDRLSTLIDGKKKLEKEQTDYAALVKDGKIKNEQAQNALKDILKEQEGKKPVFQQVRNLDTQIQETNKQINSVQKAYTKAQDQKKQTEGNFAAAQKAWDAQQKAAGTASTYLASHAADGTLVTMKANWEPRLQTLNREKATLNAEKEALQTEKKTLEKENNNLSQKAEEKKKKSEELAKVQDNIALTQKKIDEALNGQTLEGLNSLWAAAGKLQDFFKDNHTRNEFLSPGMPCPLCGSTNHPYCNGTATPEPHDYSQDCAELSTRLKTVDNCGRQLNAAQTEKATLKTYIENLSSQIENGKKDLQSKKEKLDKQTHEYQEKVTKHTDDIKTLVQEVEAALQIKWSNQDNLPQELNQRIDAFNKAQREMETLKEYQRIFDNAQTVYSTAIQNDKNLLASHEAALQDLKHQLSTLQTEREKLFGKNDVAAEEKKLDAEVNKRRTQADTCNKDLTTNETNLAYTRNSLKKWDEDIQEWTEKKTKTEADFNEKLKAHGFQNPEEFLKCYRVFIELRNKNLLAEYQEQAKQLQDAITAAKATLEQRKITLQNEERKLPKDFDSQKNQEELKNLTQQKAEEQAKYDDVQARLNVDEDKHKNNQATTQKYKKILIDFNLWNILDDLLGNKDGTQFARKAQAYTFRELLYCANRNRLTSLQKHFTLINDENAPLELNVIDHYRGDQIRTAKNLSGGESFEVSLALALGLADMSSVSQHASLGNVLLDEGFGTLDDHALESALDLLSQLNQRDQKLVGIISHVARLGERIPTQIHVKTSGGMGSLEGAGVNTGAKSSAH